MDIYFLPFFYHLPVNSLIFTNLPVNLKAGKSSTLAPTHLPYMKTTSITVMTVIDLISS